MANLFTKPPMSLVDDSIESNANIKKSNSYIPKKKMLFGLSLIIIAILLYSHISDYIIIALGLIGLLYLRP